MKTLKTSSNNQYKFVLLFRQFMLINNKHSFSSIEIKDIGIQINNILKSKCNYTVQHIIKILSHYGINNILNKHSGSTRSKLWFYTPLNPDTLKVRVNV